MDYINTMDNNLTNVSLFIKFCYFIRYGSSWTENKTKKNYTVWNVYEGNIWIEINGKTHHAAAGDSILFYPGDTYKAYTDENGCSFLFFLFLLETGNRLDILAEKNLAGIYRKEELREKCLTFCSEYLARYHSQNTASLRFYSFCFNFLIELLDSSECCVHFNESCAFPQSLPINHILDYMNKHYTENIQVKDLAAIANMSEKYFIRYFNHYAKTSPKQYLIERRMQYALDLLTNTNESISAIAEKLGYSDQYCFSKAFRKYYNDSPSAFRSAHNFAHNMIHTTSH